MNLFNNLEHVSKNLFWVSFKSAFLANTEDKFIWENLQINLSKQLWQESVELRTLSLRLLGELAESGGTALPGFQDQVKACLVCLLMHLSDVESAVVKV